MNEQKQLSKVARKSSKKYQKIIPKGVLIHPNICSNMTPSKISHCEFSNVSWVHCVTLVISCCYPGSCNEIPLNVAVSLVLKKFELSHWNLLSWSWSKISAFFEIHELERCAFLYSSSLHRLSPCQVLNEIYFIIIFRKYGNKTKSSKVLQTKLTS